MAPSRLLSFVLVIGVAVHAVVCDSASNSVDCAGVLAAEAPAADNEEGQRSLFLCQLHESSALLHQLSTMVTDGVEGLLEASGGRISAVSDRPT